jgi:acyl-CoA reductase-like NAD-dependent aldehyde dehydrogenase
VGGEWRSSDSINEVRFPYNGEVIARVCQAADSDIEDAIRSAVDGFERTRRMPSHQRSAVLHRLIQQMDRRADDFVEAMILEGGKTRGVAKAEFGRAKETIRASAEEAKRIGGEIIPMDWTAAGEQRMGFVRRLPLGPVVGIAPFNYPLNLGCHKLGPAVAAGNSFILKPASATPLSALLLAEALLEAGYPPEALSVIVCRGSQAERLVSDPRVAFMSFTGSSEVGWHLKSVAGRKRVGLELGGNAAAIVHEDANLDYAVGRIVLGGFTNAGQNCISVQRVLLHRPIYDAALGKLIEQTAALKAGDPREDDTDVGPMIDEQAAEKAAAWVREAVAAGARIAVGGRREGALLHPTILTDTTPDMCVDCQEVFAPVITVSAYDDFEEAIRRANATDFGLQSGVFTQNVNRVMKAFESMEVGGLQVNDVSTFRVDHMPYGGVKGSGIGREGPRYAIEEMTEMKLMVLNLAGGRL